MVIVEKVKAYLKEIEANGAKGMGITGGDPLLFLKRLILLVVFAISLGLDEIRFL